MPGSDREYDLVQVKDASANSKADTFFVAPKHVGRDGAGTERMVLAEVDEPPTPEVGEQYLFLGTDGDLKAKFADGSVTAIGGEAGAPDDAEYVTLASDPDLSAESLHQNLTGVQLHDPAVHSGTHESGGTDVLDVTGLSGVLADAQTPVDHALGGTFHTADTLANLNTLVSDATLDGTTDPRDPTLHGSTHQSGGADELDVTGLSGDLADAQDPTTHSLTHENGGTDEINVAGLSGDLADPQDPKTHASTHSDGGTDEITVENLGTGGAAGTVPTSDGAGGLSMAEAGGGGVSDACRVHLSSDQSLSAGAVELIEFDTVAYDTGSNFDTVTHAYTCPADGIYFATALGSFTFSGGTSDDRQVVVGANGFSNVTDKGSNFTNRLSNLGERIIAVSASLYTAGDTITFHAGNTDSSDSLRSGDLTRETHAEVVFLGEP